MQTPDSAAPAAQPGPAPGPRRPASRSRLSFGHIVTLLAGLLATVLVFSVLRERDLTFRATAAGAVIGAAASSSSLTVAVDAKQALRLAAAIRGGRFELVRSTGADAVSSGGTEAAG